MTTPEALMDAYQNLKLQAETIKNQMDQIKQQLHQALPEGGDVDGHKIRVVRGRVSWPQVAKAYPAKDFPELYEQVVRIDQHKAETLIAPAQLDQYRSEPTVSIR